MTDQPQAEMQSPEDAMIEVSAMSAAYCSLLSDVLVIVGANTPENLIAMRDNAKALMLEATANPEAAGLSRVTFTTTRFEIIADAASRLGLQEAPSAQVISLAEHAVH